MYKKRSDYRDDEEPLTPVGGYFVRPEHNHVILCAIGFENPIDIDAIKDDMTKFVLVKVPRFSALLVYDPFDGSHCWKQTHVKMDDHIIIYNGDDDVYDDNNMLSYDDIINSYMTSDIIMSSPLSLDKPLWELHVMPKHKFMIMKVHHALADGTSLMSMLWSMGKPKGVFLSNDNNGHHYDVGDVNNDRVIMSKKSEISKKSDNHKSIFNIIWEFMEFLWYSLVFKWNFIARFLWEKDEIIMKKINGTEGMGVVGQNMATATFSLDDMKGIKKAIPNATIHDVLYGIVWCGVTKYLQVRCPQALKHGAQITGLCPFNLRKQPGLQDLCKMHSESSKTLWGNKFALILTPIFYYTGKQCDLDPLMYVKKAKSYMDLKKQHPDALTSHQIGCIISTLLRSNKITSFIVAKLLKNSAFVLSNIVGPPEEIFIGGNPVSFIRITVFSPRPQAIAMHMVSYKGRGDLQVQVPKDNLFSDPKFLAKCFQDSLLNMKSGSQDNVSNALTK